MILYARRVFYSRSNPINEERKNCAQIKDVRLKYSMKKLVKNFRVCGELLTI